MALDPLDLLKRSEVGAPITALQHDQNLTAIEAAFNALRAAFLVAHNTDGTLKATLYPTPGAAGTVLTSTGAGAQPEWVAISAPSNTEALGTIKLWPNATPPAKHLLCDGALYSLAAYPVLAAFLGTSFGGDGIATFAVPDLRGRTPVGVGTGTASDATAWTLAAKRGTEGHVLTEAQLPSHTHGIGYITFSDGPQAGEDLGLTPYGYTSTGTRPTGPTGGGAAHNNLQPSLGLNFVIRYET